MNKLWIGLAAAELAVAALSGPIAAQTGSAASADKGRPTMTSPPSVGDGIGNGVVKPAGSPSVSNGVANGIVKLPGSPSVDNGVANGSAKSSTVQQ